MKKVLILVLAVAFCATLALSQEIYDPAHNKDNTISRFEVTTSDHTNSDYPIADILLKGTEADTSDAYDLHGFNELFSIWRIDEHDADTGCAHCYFQISIMQNHWFTIDSLGHDDASSRTADSSWAYKDWTFPKGAIYCRFIFTGIQAATCTTGIAYLTHAFMQ